MLPGWPSQISGDSLRHTLPPPELQQEGRQEWKAQTQRQSPPRRWHQKCAAALGTKLGALHEEMVRIHRL